MTKLKHYLPLVLFLIAFGLWALGVMLGSGYAILDYRNANASGYSRADPLFHSAYAAMLRTYGVPSTGLDGLPYIPYHFGSNWLASQLARLLNVSTMVIYNHIFPVLLPVVFMASFLWFVTGLRPNSDWKRSWLFWLILLAGTVRILPQPIADITGMWSSWLGSESNALAVSLLFAVCGMMVRGAHRHRWFLWGLLPLSALVIGLTKQSTLYLFVAGLGVVFIALQCYRRPVWWVAAILVAATCVPSYLASLGYYSSAPISPFYFLRVHVWISPLAWLMFNFGWSWLYIALRLRERKPPYIDVAVVAVLCVAGMLPALTLEILGGSGAYFLDLQRFVALAFLLAWLPERVRLLSAWKPVWKVAIVAVVVLTVFNVTLSTANLFRWLQVPQDVPSPVLDQLDEVAQTDDKSITALYIPPEHPYWSLITELKLDCMPSGFLAPAYTGMALIDGVLPECREIVGYGYSAYPPATSETLCERASAYGLHRIIVLEDVHQTSEIDC